MPPWIRKVLTYASLGAAAVITFVIALIFERRQGEQDAETELEKETRLRRVKEAAKRGDTDTIDEEWRER